jgi:hypothetical protein
MGTGVANSFRYVEELIAVFERGVKREERPIKGARTSDRPQSFSVGRICDQPGCETRLSRYNPDKVCGVHAETDRTGDH